MSRQGPLFNISDIYSALKITIATGHTDYNGYSIAQMSPNGIGGPLQQNKFGMTADAEIRLGRSFGVPGACRFQITPYLDYSYHRWIRDSIETYSDHTIGLGLLAQYAATPKWVVDMDLGVSQMFLVQLQTAHGVNETPASRPVQSASIGIDYMLKKHLHVTGMWQANIFSYGRSPPVTGWYSGMYGSWYEPGSRTDEQTLMVGLAYAF